VGGQRRDAAGVETLARARDLAAADLDHEAPGARQPATRPPGGLVKMAARSRTRPPRPRPGVKEIAGKGKPSRRQRASRAWLRASVPGSSALLPTTIWGRAASSLE